MSSEEECDYMSETFLTKCVHEDIRPGLIHNRTQRRTHNILKKKDVTDAENKSKFKPHSVVEAEHREKGLQEAIGSNNRGFALLQKMGYKPGSGIGKSGTGRIEPVLIELKAGRMGLGREAELKQIAAEKLIIRTRKDQERAKCLDTDDYRARLTKKVTERQTEADLRKSQRVCQQLDTDKNFEEALEPWFWPEKDLCMEDAELEESLETKRNEESSSGDTCAQAGAAELAAVEFEPSEKLEMLTLYLRRSYYYCIWCGTQYDDDEDLRDNCPGPSRDDH